MHRQLPMRSKVESWWGTWSRCCGRHWCLCRGRPHMRGTWRPCCLPISGECGRTNHMSWMCSSRPRWGPWIGGIHEFCWSNVVGICSVPTLTFHVLFCFESCVVPSSPFEKFQTLEEVLFCRTWRVWELSSCGLHQSNFSLEFAIVSKHVSICNVS